ncbi:MAG: acyl-CoA thioesterase [Desulfovibrionaceae bacterium]|nr:acyl-CoA thioesterase [Desulfovibrionaceae bacterium]
MRSRSRLLNPDAIAPLEASCERRVRFGELDPMGIVWHGCYASWLEDGREAIGRRYGIAYTDFHAQGFMTPLKHLSIDFVRPLRYEQVYTITAKLLWSEGARMDFAYVISDADGQVMTRAESAQLFMTLDGELLLEQPAWYRAFMERWKQGEVR